MRKIQVIPLMQFHDFLGHIAQTYFDSYNVNPKEIVNLIKFDGVFVGAAVVIRGFSYAD